MTASIITNRHKDNEMAFSCRVRNFLESRNVVIVPEWEQADFWIVLGGDGTMLGAAHKAALLGVPLLGINLGNLGFLTDAEKDDGLRALEDVLEGRYEVEPRLMLSYAGGLALNDVVVASDGRLSTFSVYVDGMHMDDIRADGIIVATPTGSTAYNLSAGGPILAPYGEMIAITAICPHSLSVRPWVVPATDEIRIIPTHDANLLIDGEKCGIISASADIAISRAEVNAKIIKTSATHFYDVLRRKKIV